MKYRKKPVIIEAIQWTGLNLKEVEDFVGSDLEYNILSTGTHIAIKIKTLEGDMKCSKDDYVIKGVKGEFYPCKPDIFEATYEEI